MNSRILPALAFIVAVGIFFAYVNPTWTGTISDLKSQIAADDQALTAAADYLKQQNQLTAARNAIDPANLAALAAFLPGSVDNVRLILDLNALAARSGLSVANIDVVMNANSAPSVNTASVANAAKTASTGVSALNQVGSVDLSLSAIGTFGGLQSFLNGVEKSARLLDVHDLVVKASNTGVYNYQMTLRLYWLR